MAKKVATIRHIVSPLILFEENYGESEISRL